MTGHPAAGDTETDLAKLRGGFNDLVGLLAVSVAWAGREADEIARMLADALLAALQLDLVLVELDGGDREEGSVYLAGGAGLGSMDSVRRDVRRICGSDRARWPAAAHGEILGTDMALATLPLGLPKPIGAIVAATARIGFPDEIETLLLNVARNQALLAMQEARRRGDDHLRASELSATALIEGIPGLVAILGPDGRVERVNRRIEDYCGQPLEELRNWGTNGIVHPDDMPHVAAVFGSSIASGAPYDIEQRLRRFDGAYRWFRNQGSPLRETAGPIIAWHVLLTDIDDRKRAEDSLRASERELRQQAETFPQMLWSAAADGSIDYCNERLLTYSGLSAEEVGGEGWVKLIHPDDRGPTAEVWMRCIETGEPYSVEVRHFNRAEQAYRWNLTMAVPLRDGDGGIVKWYGSCVDIHDLKRAEQAVKASERRLAQIIDTIPANVWSAGADGGVDFFNRCYLEYLGMPIEQLRGWNWTSVVHPADREAHLAAWSQALQSGQGSESQTRVRRFDGTYRWFLNRADALEDADGHTRWFGISIDIEDMKRAEERLRESELSLRRQTETIPQNLFGADANGSVDYLNTHLREWFGRAEETIMAEEWVHLVHPDDRDATVSAWMGTVAAGAPYRHEVRFIDRNGEYRWCDVKARPLREADGTIKAWFGVLNDIHDRKRAEEALKVSEQNLRLTIDTIPALAWSARADGSADFFSRQYLEFVGRSAADLIGWQWGGLVHPDDLATITGTWEECRRTGKEAQIEARLRRHDGVYRWFRFQTNPLRDERGEVIKWYGVNTDVEDSKRATLMLAGERELLEQIASGVPLPEALASLCRLVESVATAGALCEARTIDPAGEVFGHCLAPSLPVEWSGLIEQSPLADDATPAGISARDAIELVADDIGGDRRWDRSPARSLLVEQGLESSWCVPIVAKDARVLGVLCLHYPERQVPMDDRPDLLRRAAHIASIAIERSRVEDELRRSAFLLATAERISETGSYYWDLTHNKLTWSSQMYQIHELEEGLEPVYPNLLTTVHPDDFETIKERTERCFQGEASPDDGYRLVMPDGRIKYLRTAYRVVRHPDGYLESFGVAQDVTGRYLAEVALDKVRSELAHVTRVASLGELTASIAHEVNQPLAGIITNASTGLRLLTAEPPDIEGAIRTAQRTLRDGNRASQVIRRLRGLFRKQEFLPELFDLNDAGQEVIAICSHDLQRRHISLVTDFDPALPPVTGDRIQLQQVILNLILNAADAVSTVEEDTRRVAIETAECEPGLAQFTVRDSGIGISADDLGKVFDAFYTTKANGMGVGLSVSRSIIEQHGGRLWASPNEGPGTTFAFCIPCGRDADTAGH